MLSYRWRRGGGCNARDWSTGGLWPSRIWNSVQALAVCRQSTVARAFTCRSWFAKESCRVVKKSVALRPRRQLCIPLLYSSSLSSHSKFLSVQGFADYFMHRITCRLVWMCWTAGIDTTFEIELQRCIEKFTWFMTSQGRQSSTLYPVEWGTWSHNNVKTSEMDPLFKDECWKIPFKVHVKEIDVEPGIEQWA